MGSSKSPSRENRNFEIYFDQTEQVAKDIRSQSNNLEGVAFKLSDIADKLRFGVQCESLAMKHIITANGCLERVKRLTAAFINIKKLRLIFWGRRSPRAVCRHHPAAEAVRIFRHSKRATKSPGKKRRPLTIHLLTYQACRLWVGLRIST